MLWIWQGECVQPASSLQVVPGQGGGRKFLYSKKKECAYRMCAVGDRPVFGVRVSSRQRFNESFAEVHGLIPWNR